MAREGVAQRIEQARKRLGLSVAEAARTLGVNRRTWTNWEQVGGYSPKQEQVSSLASLLQVSTEWLETGGNQPAADGEPVRRVRSIERLYIEQLWDAHVDFNRSVHSASTPDAQQRQRMQADECLRVLLERAHRGTAPFSSEYHVSRDLANLLLLCTGLHAKIVSDAESAFPSLADAIDVSRYVRELGVQLPVIVHRVEATAGIPAVSWFDKEGLIVARILIGQTPPTLVSNPQPSESRLAES